jgi:ribosomal protein S18 acetylase RimI-like enzyme
MTSNSPSIVCRYLETTDLDRVTEIHLAAFPSSALTRLGKRPAWKYYEWLMIGPHDAVALGGYVDETLAGYCFGGIFRGALSGFLRQNRGLLVRSVLTRPWMIANPLFRERLMLGVDLLRKRPHYRSKTPTRNLGPSFGVLSIAVHPDYQGLGLGKALLTESEAIARQRGFPRMKLSVAYNNIHAIRFYEAQGWQKFPAEDWQGAMFKDLENEQTGLSLNWWTEEMSNKL